MRIGVVVLLILIFIPLVVVACGPDFETVFLEFQLHPDFPFQDYVAGNLGIIRPSFRAHYLYMAYRTINGPAFTNDERRELTAFLKYKVENQFDETSGVEEWNKARTLFDSAAKPEFIDSGRVHLDGDAQIWYQELSR